MKQQETPEHKIKRLEQELRDAKDLNYVQHEMLKEMDRITGSKLEKSIYPNGKNCASVGAASACPVVSVIRYQSSDGISATTGIPSASEQLKPVHDWVLHWRRFMPRLGTRKLYHLLEPRLTEAGIKLGRY